MYICPYVHSILDLCLYNLINDENSRVHKQIGNGYVNYGI